MAAAQFQGATGFSSDGFNWQGVPPTNGPRSRSPPPRNPGNAALGQATETFYIELSLDARTFRTVYSFVVAPAKRSSKLRVNPRFRTSSEIAP